MTTIGGSPRPPLADTPLGRTIATTPTDIWNDSCSVAEIGYAVSFGAVGATANPTIVTDVWKSDPHRWSGRVSALTESRPTMTEVELAWAVVEEMSIEGARLLEPAFAVWGGRQGRLSIQTDPTLYRTPDAMLAQGRHLATLAPNIIIKFPATSAGIDVIEDATAAGISVNVTVCFSVSQAIAAGEAIERGLERRAAAGQDTATMGPVVTIMMGRLEDWLRVVIERDGLVVDPTSLPWSGIAVFKQAYRLFRERRLRARLLGAAIRHHLHWSELIGGDVVLTLPAAWQHRFNASSVSVRPRIDDPVDPAIIHELERLPEFRTAFEPDGLSRADFDRFGPTARTLRAFISSYHELLHRVTEAAIPDPDVRTP